MKKETIKWTVDLDPNDKDFFAVWQDESGVGATIAEGIGDEKHAHLFAAAREMLEACETALDNLAPVYASDHLVIKKLRAAITKAKGETS